MTKLDEKFQKVLKNAQLLTCLASSFPFFEFLHKYFPNDDIIRVFENSTKDNSYSIRLGFHIPLTRNKILFD